MQEHARLQMLTAYVAWRLVVYAKCPPAVYAPLSLWWLRLLFN